MRFKTKIVNMTFREMIREPYRGEIKEKRQNLLKIESLIEVIAMELGNKI